MAISNIVPAVKYKKNQLTCIRCFRCKTLYATDRLKAQVGTSIGEYYEQCPVCDYEYNSNSEKISQTQFKFIRWWRDNVIRSLYDR